MIKRILMTSILRTGTLVAQEAKVTPLLSKELRGIAGKEGLMITVDYAPEATDAIHRHNAHVFVYVLDGSALDHQLHAAEQSVDVAELGLTLARQEVERARRRFETGVATNIEVITAQSDLARADDNRIQALYRFNQARAHLARSNGHAEDTYGL
jgi:Outer membrane efflux protein